VRGRAGGEQGVALTGQPSVERGDAVPGVVGDEAADLAYIWNYYKGIPGANPELGIS